MSAIVTAVKTRAGVLASGRARHAATCAGSRGRADPRRGKPRPGLLTGIFDDHRDPRDAGPLYAHVFRALLESDADLPDGHDGACTDFARQFVEFPHGDG